MFHEAFLIGAITVLMSRNKVTKYLIPWNVYRVPPSDFQSISGRYESVTLIFFFFRILKFWLKNSRLNLLMINCFDVVMHFRNTPF